MAGHECSDGAIENVAFVEAWCSDVVEGQRSPVPVVQLATRLTVDTLDLQEINNYRHFTHVFNIAISLSLVLRIIECLSI